MGNRTKGKNKKKHNYPINPSVQQPRNLENNHVIEARFERHQHHGPLPHPHILDAYDKIVPGAAERIITQMEQQAAHRQALENRVIDSDIFDSKLGLALGAIVSVAAITGGVVCAIFGHETGVILAAIPVPTLAAVFVYGSQQRRKEREGRLQEKPSPEKKS
jgi:uncharacterized membrane protein